MYFLQQWLKQRGPCGPLCFFVCLVSGHCAQVRAALEGLLTNRCDGIGELDRGQRGVAFENALFTFAERRHTDLSNGHAVNRVRNFDARSTTSVPNKREVVGVLDDLEHEGFGDNIS